MLYSIFFLPSISVASTTSGTIDATNRYAWSENAGWIDFGTPLGAVTVTDSSLTGYAYGENIGWISLNCSNTSSCASNAYAVVNNGSGTLSGYAWSENAGWINFAPSGGGVSIISSGIFLGYAYSENTGWINFTVDHPVTTDWRPASVRNASVPAPTPVVSSGGGGGSVSSAILATLLVPSASTTAYLNSLKNPVPACPAGLICTPQAPASTTPIFPRDMYFGISGPDVKNLQAYLNTHGLPINTSPLGGSPGHETTYFGALTQSALAQFQKAHGITPSVGYFGPKTRMYIISHP